MKLILLLDLVLMSSGTMAAWCTSYGISTSLSCDSGRFQFCCDGPNSPINDFNIFRGDCTRPAGNSRNCGDGGYVSCGDDRFRLGHFKGAISPPWMSAEGLGRLKRAVSFLQNRVMEEVKKGDGAG